MSRKLSSGGWWAFSRVAAGSAASAAHHAVPTCRTPDLGPATDDAGPDFRHAWMLRQDGGQIDGVSLSANEAPVEDVTQDDQEPILGAMSEEQAAKLYDRVWIANLSPQDCRIEPQADLDLLKLEADGDFSGVTLRARIFSRKKKVLGNVVTMGGDSVGSSITKIVLADTIRNEVRRQLRKVPENAGNQGERLELIRWLLHQARSESWIYEIARKQADVYMVSRQDSTGVHQKLHAAI